MDEPKISLYTRILRFFLRDLYRRTDELYDDINNINNINNQNLKQLETVRNQTGKIFESLEKTEENYQSLRDGLDLSEKNFNDFKEESDRRYENSGNYRTSLEERLKSDDVTTIELSHRIEILEDKLKNNFELFNKKTYSQSGEDAIIMYVMAMLGIPISECNYLDLGANHPKTMSNTYFFYEQGARGVLVEANFSLIPKLQRERPEDIILNKCITNKTGDKMPFNILNLDGLSKVGDVSGILAENPDARLIKTVELETITVGDIIEKYFSGKAPVIMNLDIEGLEMQILDSIDFEKYRPLIMIIEMIPYSKKLAVGQKDTQLLNYVKSKGYEEYAFTGINSIFIDNRRTSCQKI